jgi:drug/metabolite transporter (DMT)-like permease
MHGMTQDRAAGGLMLALVSATSFGLSGALAGGLLHAGWSAGAAVLCRVAIAAGVVAPMAVRALGGRWDLLAANWRLIAAYGAIAVAGTQFCYFSAIGQMDVGPALLIEYTAPAAIVGWLWLRHGERPAPLTLAGAAIAAAGLVLVLDLVSGADLAVSGVGWALAAMLGAAVYFVLSARADTGLPALSLAGAGLLAGALLLGLLGASGLLPLRASTASATYADVAVPWWLPLAGLGVVTAAVAYTTGIAATRILGSRLASFVALLEVVAAVGFAWLLLAQLPGAAQLAGGVLILLGIAVVRAAERPPERRRTPALER